MHLWHYEYGEKGKTTLQSDRHPTGGWKAGSAIFLVLALLLALFSGDALLVLAVASAIGGLALLATQAARPATVRRPSAVPLMEQSLVTPMATPRRTHATRSGSMAERRYRSIPAARKVASAADGGRAANAPLTEPTGHAQVVQLLQ